MTTVTNLSVTALVLMLLISVVIPYASAFLTDHPSVWTGYATMVLAALTGFVTEWADKSGHYNWKAGLYNALVSLVVAVISHTKAIAGSRGEATLHSIGPKLGKAPTLVQAA